MFARFISCDVLCILNVCTFQGVDPINAESCQALCLSWEDLLPQPLCPFPLPGVQVTIFETRSNRKVYFYIPHLCFQFFKDQMSSVLPFTDIVFGNETEAAAYAESFELNTTDVGEIAMKIAQLPKVLIPKVQVE